MARLEAVLLERMDAFRHQGLERRLRPLGAGPAGRSRLGGRVLLNFSGNDYLGLSHHPLLAARAAEWAAQYGAGAGASRLVCGTLTVHEAVERKLAALKGTEAALLFASGWQANAAVLAALLRAAGAGALVFADRLNHASLHHGCAAAGVGQIRFRHNDLAHLEALLERHADCPGPRFIVTESVFSMDGDIADVPALRQLAARHDAFLYLDEAHATGVLGPRGMGLAAAAPAGVGDGGTELVMGTFSKALGGFGAYVAASHVVCDFLVHACSGFVHTTALPPPVLGAIDAALDLVPGMEAERAVLARHAALLRQALRQAGIDTGASVTQIVPAVIGPADEALRLAAALEAEGILAVAIRPPTVPPGTSRLRLTVTAAHAEAEVRRLAEALIRLWPRPAAGA